MVVPFNDLDAMRAAFEEQRDEIAALIVEPIPCNMGVVLPRPAYLPLLRSLCDQHGALLIFDEVITGFRVARGGAQQICGVRPDLTCLGKIAGGGLPLAVYGGRADIMDVVAPQGPVYQAGTLAGNPLAVAAGLATLKRLDDHAYVTLEGLGRVLEDDLGRAIRRSHLKARVQRIGSAFTLFFSPEEVVDLATAKQASTELYAKFFHGMLDRGFMLPPAQFEAAFVSLAHSLRTSTSSRPRPARCSPTLASVPAGRGCSRLISGLLACYGNAAPSTQKTRNVAARRRCRHPRARDRRRDRHPGYFGDTFSTKSSEPPWLLYIGLVDRHRRRDQGARCASPAQSQRDVRGQAR